MNLGRRCVIRSAHFQFLRFPQHLLAFDGCGLSELFAQERAFFCVLCVGLSGPCTKYRIRRFETSQMIMNYLDGGGGGGRRDSGIGDAEDTRRNTTPNEYRSGRAEKRDTDRLALQVVLRNSRDPLPWPQVLCLLSTTFLQ